MLDSLFLNGLKEEVCAEVKLYDYVDLADLMDRALLVEEKNAAISRRNVGLKERSDWKSPNSKFRSTWGNPRELKEGNKGSSSGTEGGEKKVYEGVRGKKLDLAELEERSKKGLCFKCGDKWNRAHVCKFKHMKLMLCEVEEEEEEEVEASVEEEEVVEEGEAFKTLQLSLQSKEGLTSNKSFKVWGVINGRLILIDNGATSNFISPKLVEELKLLKEDTPVFLVEVGTGEVKRNRGVCRGLEFEVQGVEFIQNFFLMELGGTELVL